MIWACLHAAEFSAQALVRLRPELHTRPCVVIEGEAPLEQVCARNREAARLGVRHAMGRTQLDLFTGVAVLRRSLPEEAAARAVLLDCAGAFSPRVEDRSDDAACTLVLDVSGTERLLGEPSILLDKLREAARTLGFHASVVLSHNAMTAICLARSGRSRAVPKHAEREALAELPVSALQPAPQYAELFAHWGIRTLGELARMPEEGLITRLGQEGKRLRTLALGRGEHLLLPVEPVEALEEYVAFDAPVELLDSLLFVLQPMLDQVLARADLRALALSRLTVVLTLDNKTEHAVRVRPALPSEDKKLLLKLLHLEMAAHPPATAVTAVRLKAEAAPLSKVQLGLFSPQLPEPSRLDVTLARLRALVGEDRVGKPVLDDAHAADSFHIEPFTITNVASSAQVASAPLRTALRRLRPPEPVQVAIEDQRPRRLFFRAQRYAVERAYGPWRTSGAWWSAEAWTSEQWDVLARDPNNVLLAFCLARDIAAGSWQVEALYD